MKTTLENTSKSTSQKIFGFILRVLFLYFNRGLILFGFILIIVFLLSIKLSISLMNNITPGVIEVKSIETSESLKQSYKVIYIQNIDEQSFTGKLQIPNNSIYSTGDNIPVYYDSTNPSKVILNNDIYTIWRDVILALGLLIGIITMYFVLNYCYKKILIFIENKVKKLESKYKS